MRKSDKFHVSENLQNIIIFRGEKFVHLPISLLQRQFRFFVCVL
jgi:hypothetical protein